MKEKEVFWVGVDSKNGMIRDANAPEISGGLSIVSKISPLPLQ